MSGQQFLAEVREQVGHQIPADVVESRLRELRSHIDLATEAYVELGDDRVGAESQAVRAMGDPRLLADDLIRQFHRTDRASAWRLCRWTAPLIALIAVAPAFLLPSWAGLVGSFEQIIQILTILAVTIFMCHVAVTRRWLFLPVSVWSTGVAVLCVLLSFLSTPPSHPNSPNPVFIEGLSKERTAIQAWQAGMPPTSLGPIEVPSSGVLTLLYVPFPIPQRYPSSYMMKAMTPDEAKAAWATYGRACAEAFPQKEREVMAMVEGKSYSWPERWGALARITLITFALSGFVLGVFNAMVLWIVSRARRRRAARITVS